MSSAHLLSPLGKQRQRLTCKLDLPLVSACLVKYWGRDMLSQRAGGNQCGAHFPTPPGSGIVPMCFGWECFRRSPNPLLCKSSVTQGRAGRAEGGGRVLRISLSSLLPIPTPLGWLDSCSSIKTLVSPPPGSLPPLPECPFGEFLFSVYSGSHPHWKPLLHCCSPRIWTETGLIG